MKLLLTANLPYFPALGGANKANRFLVEGLAAKHHSVRVVVPALGNPSRLTYAKFSEELAARGIDVRHEARVDIFDLNGVEVHAVLDPSRLRAHLIEQIRAFEPDWTLVSSEDLSQNLLDAAVKTCSSPIAYLAHTPTCFPFGPQSFFPSTLRTKLLERVTIIVAVSKYVQRYIKQWGGFESVLFYMPVYGSGPFPCFGRFDDGFVMTINPCQVKGISIFTSLAKELPEVQFAAVPTWGTTTEDRAILERLPNVHLLEPCADFDRILAQARVIIMPSLWHEAFGLTVVEAMLRGIPVLASDVGGLGEAKLNTDFILPVRPIGRFTENVDDHHVPVAVIPEQDIKPWHNALSKLISNRSFYEQQSKAARDASLEFVSHLGVEPFENLLLTRMMSGGKESPDPSSKHKAQDLIATAAPPQKENISTIVAELTPEQRALLTLRLRQKAAKQAAPQPGVISIKPVQRGLDTPLSFAQQRLWFLDQLELCGAAYNIPIAMRLTGSLNVGALEQSLNEIVRRHEILRTNFVLVDGSPAQIIFQQRTLRISVDDLTGLPEAEREAKVLRLATAESQRSFDLSQDPLLRARLLQLSGQEHVLLLMMHHIVNDDWSAGVLFHELGTLYEAFSNGRPSPLPDLTIQYADFAVYQREWLTQELLEKQLSYWREQLNGAPALLELPADRVRPAVQTFRGAQTSVMLPKDLSERLNELSKRERVTLYMTLLAAFQTLLLRYTGQDDIVVGSPIANRNHAGVEKLIGFFVNTLVIRTNLSGNPSFRELLQRVRKVALGAYSHQDLPFERLVEELHPLRSLSHSPLLQVMFVLQNAGKPTLKLPGLAVGKLDIDKGTTIFDLTLSATETPEGLSFLVEYSTDLFNDATIARMLLHFQILLEGIVADPDKHLSELPLLSAAERHQLLTEWNIRKEDPGEQTIHQLFEEQVERTPEAVALVFHNERLGYGELNERANQLAHYLQRIGVGPEVLVAISVERSVEMVIGLLGILKAGGAYLPLDPDYPRERISFMLADSRAPVLITQERLVESLPKSDAQIVCIDRDWEEIARESRANPQPEVKAENLAYIIYTSGSTGRPKGVAIEHHSPVTLLEWTKAVFSAEDLKGVLASTSVCFDLSVFELFVTLTRGGKLILAADALHLSELAAANEVTLINTGPSVISELVRIRGIPSSVRTINLAGEVLSQTLVERLYKQKGIKRVFDLYGPSEDTTYSTYALRSRRGVATIGRPISNTQIYILDQHEQPVPVGVPGELYIGGDGLARGYLNRPELSSERFTPNPFSSEQGARLYRTGDLARYLLDGSIEYLGRVDHQVKIRGFRIEPGEVESVLSEHPGVRECVVMAREDDPGEKRLVGYLVPERAEAPTVSELRSHLQQKLPDYMLPTAFVALDALPLTPNGKVDRRRLPAPGLSRPELEEKYVAARNPIEEVLVGIWSQVLKVEQVGIYDNFFELGGHSLSATMVMSRLRTAFRIDLPVRALFESPTIATLSDKFEQARRGQQELRARPLLPQPGPENLPLSFAQQRLWFLDQLQPGHPVLNIRRAIRLKGGLDVQALTTAINEIVARHEALRTTFAVVDGQPRQVIAQALTLVPPIVNLQELPKTEREAEASRLTAAEAQRPFDLTQGPLVRATLLRLAAEEHILLLTMHHIISDGWSLSVFFQELASLYEAFSAGQPSPLPELLIQYADYAVWQRERLQGEVLERQLSYWREQLAGAPAALELPTDRVRPAVQTLNGATQFKVLPSSLTNAVKALSQREGVTLFMTLLAAFSVLLQRYTEQDDILVGTPIATRDRTETEPLIGCFLNNLVLRTRLSGDSSFQEVLAQVRETTLGAYEHQEAPFERLVEDLKPERDPSRTPLFQVFFNLLNFTDKTKLPGSTEETLSFVEAWSQPDDAWSQFDFTLYAIEQNDVIQLKLLYSPDLFEQSRMTEMLEQFQHLLEQAVAEPTARIQSYSLVTSKSRSLLPDPSLSLAEPQYEAISETFQQWADRLPKHLAIYQGSRAWTYGELSDRARALAQGLLAHGLERGDVVAVTGARSFGLVASFVAVLSSGGVLLTIDPNLPAARQQLMLREAGAKRLIYVGRWKLEDQWMRELPSLTIVHVDENEGFASQLEKLHKRRSIELPELSPDDPAYIFFTSGTSGVPKGVLGCHKGLSHFLKWQRETFAVGPQDRCAQLTGLSFDVVLRDIFLPLSSGASLHLPKELSDPGLSQILSWLESEKITLIHSVPALAQSWLLNIPSGVSLRALRCIFFAGEPLTDSLVRRWREAFPESGEIVNLYGTTETTLANCFYVVPTDLSSGIQPVGWPLPETQALVLGKGGELCGIGELGEITIRTPFRTLGYLNAPEENRKRFVKNPFHDEEEDLLYHTGDRGRYRLDGSLEILGRSDDQVKIHGVRVEPAEVNAILSQHAAVKSCVVIARQDEHGQSSLVAYVVAPPQRRTIIPELRAHLSRQLPSVMVPGSFVLMDELPVTPNGKVDRRALPVPDSIRPELSEAFVAPSTPTEEMVAGIWAAVLERGKVGIHDNFFELGGHSLKATQVISRIGDAFQVELPLRTVFNSPTVAELALAIEERLIEGLEKLTEDEVHHFAG